MAIGSSLDFAIMRLCEGPSAPALDLLSLSTVCRSTFHFAFWPGARSVFLLPVAVLGVELGSLVAHRDSRTSQNVVEGHGV